jgi:tripartite-type tricarboxylate transporter receptor subunit TctC
MNHRTLWRALFTAVLAAAPAALAADIAYPTKPIRMVIPVAPGGGIDLLARLLGQKYTEAWGQQVVPDTRPGAGQTIGIDIASKAAPDGYTLIVVNPAHAINATLMPKLPYDAVRDFQPISVLATQPYAVVVSQSLPVKSVKELIALAKSKPNEINYASSGPGSASHLATELFISMTGVQMTHVPYKGTGPAIPDLTSGRVPIMINPILAVSAQIQSGRLRVIAVTSPKRSPSLPEVPTVSETVPGYEASAWYLLMAPAKTPPPIIAKLNAETVKAVQSKEIREVLAKSGTDALGNSPQEASEFLKAEVARWGKVIKTAKVKPE